MNLCSHTPNLSVFDSRGLPVRHVGFYRADAQSSPEPRISLQALDPAGRLFATTDPRLDRPSTSTVFSLSGQPLLTENVDAGWRLTLLGEAGQALESHDSRSALSSVEYDEMMRPLAMAETLNGEAARVSDRFIYGDASAPGAAHNQCGRLLRRDDPAGSVGFSAYGLTGAVLHQDRRFLAQAGSVDWPQEPSQRDLLLEAQRYLSTSKASASGEVIEQTDAQENRRILTYACSGELTSTALRSSGSDKIHVSVRDIRYHAMGAAEREVAGNGVISRYTYDEADGRLTRMLALSPAGQALQDLNYSYDPVGNVVSVEDATQEVSFFKNQRVDPINRYVYDSFYQLIEATGREVAPVSHLPGLPGLQPLPLDPGKLINYTQRFEYDAGANLLARHHSGTETWRMAVSSASNRSLPQRADGTLPDEGQIAEGFDANGNLKALQPDQAMTWDARNQLSEVTAVKREDGPDDSELYRYDGEGQRVRKVRVSQTRSRTLTAEVRYLPGLEIHRNEATGEVRHVLTVEAGRSSVRLLHWESGKPDGIENDQLRYSLNDHLGSSTLELDQDAKLISHQGYYPFGGTAWWAVRSAVEAKYKTVRYSGKERDSTGLYYYGFRYYAPWLQRWVNPDPAEDVDGLNRYRMVMNNPPNYRDEQGLNAVPILIPADIFVDDILSPFNQSIGSGWFEELRWNAELQQFDPGERPFGRGMEPMLYNPSDWYLSDAGSAFAVFRDADSHLRLFVNNYQQHMGIQPGMGLPLATGIIRRGQGGSVHVDNHSGHYKPDPGIDVPGLFKEIAPQAEVKYTPIEQSSGSRDIPRLKSMTSPEDYSESVAFHKSAPKQTLIDVLKDEGVWESLHAVSPDSFALKVLRKIDGTGISYEHAANELTRELTPPPPLPPAPRRKPLPVRRPTPTAVSTVGPSRNSRERGGFFSRLRDSFRSLKRS